jgi:hypothetical protein
MRENHCEHRQSADCKQNFRNPRQLAPAREARQQAGDGEATETPGRFGRGAEGPAHRERAEEEQAAFVVGDGAELR